MSNKMELKTIQELETIIKNKDAIEQLQYIKDNVQQSSTVDEGLIGWCRETKEMKEEQGNTLKMLKKFELIEEGSSLNVDTGNKEIKAKITYLGSQVLEFAKKFQPPNNKSAAAKTETTTTSSTITNNKNKPIKSEDNKINKKITIPPLKRNHTNKNK